MMIEKLIKYTQRWAILVNNLWHEIDNSGVIGIWFHLYCAICVKSCAFFEVSTSEFFKQNFRGRDISHHGDIN